MQKGLKTRKSQRFVILVGALASLSVAIFLVLFALGGDSLSLFLQPSSVKEKQALGELKANQKFRLGGLVESGSFTRLEDGLTYTFKITDCASTINVSYKGILPDLFREGQGVVTEGALTADNIFIAETVLAKHDENYAPPGTIPVNAEACSHPATEAYSS